MLDVIKYLKKLYASVGQIYDLVIAHSRRHSKGGADEVSLDASQITSGVLSIDRIPTIPYTKTDFADQDLKTTSSPVFAGLTVNGNAVVKGSISTDGFVFLQGLIGTGQTDASGNATITFSTAFPSTPLVFVQAVDPNAQGIVIDVVSVSTTGFTVKARKVTGITSGSAGDHYHSFTPSGSIGSAGDHYHSFTPSGSIGYAGGHSHTISAVSDHSHSFSATTGYEDSIKGVYNFVFQDCPSGHTNCQLYGYTISLVADQYHRHNVSGTTSSAGGHDHGGYTGSVGDHSHSFTGSTGNTSTAGGHTHSFTGSTGNTSTAGAHTHSVDAPVLSVNFVWIAVKV
jgi:hypothetical protein